jgi:hypothetical protein
MRQIAAGMAVAVVLTACASESQGEGDSSTALEEAAEAVPQREAPYVEVGDDGRTLTIDGDGEEGLGMSYEATAELLDALGAPDAIVSRMGQTRALDGTQEGSWEGYEATWTFHPDAGLDIVIELASE